MFPYMGS